MRRASRVVQFGLSVTVLVAASASVARAQDNPIKTAALAGDQLRGSTFHNAIEPPSALSQAVTQALAAARTGATKDDRAFLKEIATVYGAHGNTLVWLNGDQKNPRAQAIAVRMASAVRDGLDRNDYPLPERVAVSFVPSDTNEIGGGNLNSRAEFDVAFSLSVVRYVTHLASGRLRPASISRIITQTPERPEVSDIFQRLTTAQDIETAFSSFQPPHKQYALLKGALAKMLDATGPQKVRIPAGPLLRPGAANWRVALLRQRLGFVSRSQSSDPGLNALRGSTGGFTRPVYDDDIADAVRRIQATAGLVADGIIGPKTLAVLNGGTRSETISAIRLNMERWRWMPRDLGSFHIRVNIPEFHLRVIHNGRPVHETRVVVGKTTNKTPVFSDEMEHMIVNPYWNVPVSILRNEMLPALRRNPRGYVAKRGYEVLAISGGRARKVDPGSVNWSRASASRYRIRQRPGDRNALGRIKFIFPNKHSVYLHDTPSKSLFSRDSRAFSHGCVRVQNPFDLAEALLVSEPKWNGAQVRKMAGGKQRRIKLDEKIPVHLSYFTLTADDRGGLSTFPDIYGYDARMRKALGL